MITRDGVTYPGDRDELLATGRWAIDRYIAADEVREVGSNIVRSVRYAIAHERDLALRAKVAELTDQNREQAAEIERLRGKDVEWNGARLTELERLRIDASAMTELLDIVTKERDAARAEIERLRAQVPTRERVIEAIRLLLYPSSSSLAEKRRLRQRLDIIAAIEDGAVPPAVVFADRIRAAARLLGLDVREARDPEQKPPTAEGAGT